MADKAYSQQTPSDSASDFGLLKFHIDQRLARVRTVVLVQVTAVKGGNGAVAAPSTVSVKPLVKIIDGQGNVSSHGIVNNVLVWRPSSALGAVIIDPQVNDIGLLAVCDRDISSVVANKAEAQPGSRRKFDLADGVYLGSLFGATPQQYVTFTSNGIKIADKNSNTLVMGSTGVAINGLLINQQGQVAGNLPVNGALQLEGEIEALNGSTYTGDIRTGGNVLSGYGTADQVGLQTHTHTSGAQGGQTSAPTAGT